jgi:hypothetical protein
MTLSVEILALLEATQINQEGHSRAAAAEEHKIAAKSWAWTTCNDEPVIDQLSNTIRTTSLIILIVVRFY